MSTFKPGDLAIIVKPATCCGWSGGIGKVITLTSTLFVARWKCRRCDKIGKSAVVLYRQDDKEGCIETDRIKKIDPPAESDSLPTKRDLEVPA